MVKRIPTRMGNSVILKSFQRLVFSQVAKSTSYVFAGNISSALFSFLFTIILVRYLSIENFGYFSALLSLMILVTTFTDIGIGSTLSAFIPTLKKNKVRENQFLKSAFVIQILVLLLIFILVVVSARFISGFLLKNENSSFLIIIMAIVAIFNVLCNFYISALSARKQFHKIGIQAVFGGVVRCVLLFTLIMMTKVTLENIMWVEVFHFGILAFFLIGLVNFEFLNAHFNVSDAKKLLSFTPFVGISKIISSIYSRLDILMLVALGSSIDAGLYSIAFGIISVFQLLSHSFMSVIAPDIASISNLKSARIYLGKVVFAISILIGFAIILFVTAHPFMRVLFGSKGENAAQVLQLLLVGILFYLAVIPFSSLILYYFRKPYVLTLNGFLQLGIIIIGNLYFIPLYGKLGPTYSLILAYACTFFISTFWVLYAFGNNRR